MCDTLNYNVTITATGANLEPYNETTNPKGVRSVGAGNNRNVQRGTLNGKNSAYMTSNFYTAP